MYASLLISLLASFIAMLGKQWLNRYLRNYGGSMIERCGDRQRKCDGLEKWPLHLFVESLPVMLQIALLLLACGLSRHMWSINTSVASVIIALTGLGVLFYLGIVIAGMSSYGCPFQTPASIGLHGPWKKLRHGIITFIVYCNRAHRKWNWGIRPLFPRRSPRVIPLNGVQVRRPGRWLKPDDHAIIRRTNVNDVRCVSWILRNITDPETLDATIRLAGIIRWFEDGIKVEPLYDLIVSTFRACFDSNGKVYPGSRDRAYYSGRAILWIRTLAACRPEELANRFAPPTTNYTAPAPDHDLIHLLTIDKLWYSGSTFLRLLVISPGHTPSHSRWISNLLLHYSWANRTTLDFNEIQNFPSTGETTIPLNVIINRLLVWCICLDSPVEEEVLKVPDKSCDVSCSSPFKFLTLFFISDRLELILRQLSRAIAPAINTTHSRHKLVPHVLRDLIKLENRPQWLTEEAYDWCSVICENQSLEDRESLLLDSLEIGFRHLDSRTQLIPRARLTHTKRHRGSILADAVFKSKNPEAIADLLHAWTSRSSYHEPAHTLLSICAGHLVDLHSMVPFSSRLRRLAIRSVELIGWEGFEKVEAERFVELLNYLHVGVEDVGLGAKWIPILLGAIGSPGGAQCLSDRSWEILELTTPELRLQSCAPCVMTSLLEAQEWAKLECWVGMVWMKWPPKTEGTTEDLKRIMGSLFHHRPSAPQKLTQWITQWGKRGGVVPKHFERVCDQAREVAQQDIP